MKMITFNQANKNNGWLSIWSPHGIKFKNNLWPNCAHAWYGTRYKKPPNRNKIGALAINNYIKDSEEQNENILHILEEILLIKINTHKILKDYLLSTGTFEIVFSVSKYDTSERKWLGKTIETNEGENMLGKLWMRIRESLTNKYDEYKLCK